MGSAIGSTCSGTDMLLHEFGQLHTTLHVGVLDELEHDVAFGRVGVEALIVLLIVFLHDDDGVLALCHIKVLRDALLAATHPAASQSIGLEAAGYLPAGQSVDMYGDEEVGLVAVGYLGALPKFEKHVRLAGIDDLHVGTVLLDILTYGQSHLQRQVFLFRDGTYAARIPTSMTCIDDHDEGFIGSDADGYSHPHQSEQSEYTFTHLLAIVILMF